MKIVLSWVALLSTCAGLTGGAEQAGVPVLVELFTSEGCSSCPPADRLLARIGKEQPFPGVDAIVLSEHVDYWNQLGWADPFSSAQFSERQREYARRLHGEVYTPEMVVDGARGFVGSDEKELRDAIRKAGAARKSALTVLVSPSGKQASISVRGAPAKGSLFVALAQDSVDSQVLRGENSGKHLTHVGVVYALRELGRLDGKSGIERELTMGVKPGSRVVAFVSGNAGLTAAGQARM